VGGLRSKAGPGQNVTKGIQKVTKSKIGPGCVAAHEVASA
jgi:hypothetical protein